jgi:hypothetical protein
VSNKDKINAKPEPVRIVIQAFITKASLMLANPDFEVIGGLALRWFDGLMMYERDVYHAADLGPLTETELAETLLAKLRTRPVWDKLLEAKQDGHI